MASIFVITKEQRITIGHGEWDTVTVLATNDAPGSDGHHPVFFTKDLADGYIVKNGKVGQFKSTELQVQ